MVRKFLHMVLVLMAVIPWIVAVNCAAICLALVVSADKISPDIRWGNCWSYVGAKWFNHGGYILVRYADDIRLFGRLRIPHAIWVKTLNNAEINHIVPITRTKNKFVPWRVLYFPFYVSKYERARNAIK